MAELGALEPHYAEIDFADLVATSERIVLQGSNAKARARRTETVDLVIETLRGKISDEHVQMLEALRRTIDIFEDGYDRVLSALQKTEFGKLTPEQQLSICLCFASYQFDQVRIAIASRLSEANGALPYSMSFRDWRDRPIPPGAVVDMIVAAAGATLKMIAAAQKWDGAGHIVLPTFEILDESECMLGGINQTLAHSWRTWNRLEELHRFCGAPVSVTASEELQGAPPELKRIVRFGHSRYVIDQVAASYRAEDLMHQNQMEQAVAQSWRSKLAPPHRPAALPPDEIVSEAEFVAVLGLSEVLSFAIIDDMEELNGLRIVEWLRGLAVLSNIATFYDEERSDADPPVLVLSDEEIVGALERGGLSASKSAYFIDAVTFHQKSIDLFDAPLISVAGGKKLLFLPTLIGQNHTTVLLSLLSRQKVKFESKGKAFEKRVVELFNNAGIYARSFSFKEEGEEYEIDALVDWGGRLFLFECKNRTLPSARPVAMRDFEHEMRDAAKQVLRQKSGLEKWPDVVRIKFGKSIDGLEIVPCVLNNLPYARAEADDGVFFYDFSSLKRFMSSGSLRQRVVATFRGGDRRELRIPTIRIWNGAEPKAEDLLKQLKEPVALRICFAHMGKDVRTFNLDEETLVVSDEIHREDISEKAMAELAGRSWNGMRRQQARFVKKAKKSRQKEEREKQR
ncbi:nuclease-related domain-containing protein [Rhizobium lusitanum]|uniref:NERD domain-containing protein n=1 Tax=Rhizobium lusitanum TaxID=293958 RepID=A0A7X0MFK9_9HYPH|nr:nuclease-related domain-containing protein [Rhizobium lusitanum]MBB6488874.1 hypothetical protein [Rhizobium lusitanum]